MTIDQALEKSKNYLSSDSALQSIARDPYWPKWDSPWWHMRLLQEMGLAKEIPEVALLKMVEVLKSHYLSVFPIHAHEVPAGTDPFRKIACHCAVGSVYQVLFHAGIDVDQELSWMRPWMLKYQLPDGGLNCDESVYTKQNPKSSIVTTINCLEALFFCRKGELTKDEFEFLNRGAQYLLRQKLFRKISNGEVVDSNWLEIKFPRFYDYDYFRGFYFLFHWSKFSGMNLPADLVSEVRELVLKQLGPDGIVLQRYNLVDSRSYNPQPDGSWVWGNASGFELLKAVSQNGIVCDVLTAQWNEIKDDLFIDNHLL